MNLVRWFRADTSVTMPRWWFAGLWVVFFYAMVSNIVYFVEKFS